MEGEVHCIVYGSEFLCNFNEVSEPITQIILKILNFKYELLDISKLFSHSQDVCAEIEQIGQTFITLARKLQECRHGEEGSIQKKAECARQNVDTEINESMGLCDRTNECDILEQLQVSFIIEQQKNDKLQSKINELRSIQEERLTRLEEQVKQAESAINERLKVKKLDRRKEQVQNVLKSGHVYSRRLQKNEQERIKSPTPRILALPQCHSKASDQGYEHTRLGSPVPPRSLKEKKEELQLQEEIKWSRITPIPVHRTRRKYQHNLPLPQKRT